MGSMLLIWCFEIGQIPIIALLFLCPLCKGKCRSWAKKKLRGIFWN